MANDIRSLVESLNPEQAISACDSLIIRLDLHMEEKGLKPISEDIDLKWEN
jgi:hypothetical protein